MGWGARRSGLRVPRPIANATLLLAATLNVYIAGAEEQRRPEIAGGSVEAGRTVGLRAAVYRRTGFAAACDGSAIHWGAGLSSQPVDPSITTTPTTLTLTPPTALHPSSPHTHCTWPLPPAELLQLLKVEVLRQVAGRLEPELQVLNAGENPVE